MGQGIYVCESVFYAIFEGFGSFYKMGSYRNFSERGRPYIRGGLILEEGLCKYGTLQYMLTSICLCIKIRLLANVQRNVAAGVTNPMIILLCNQSCQKRRHSINF